MKTLPLIFAAISVLMPFIMQKTGLSEKYGFKIKMLCAALYLVTGAASAFSLYRATDYSLMMLAALVSGIFGDFFLSYKNDRYFYIGVLFFALGHIAYSYTFLCIGDYRADTYTACVFTVTAVLTLITVLLAKTKLRLKGKKNLLLVYAPVLILAFVCSLASGFVAVGEGNPLFGACLISGGTLFFASDIMIGVGKGGINRPGFLHNAVTYTYFAAQTLFALSIYFQ